uniref:Decapping nuclease n=1 Tax=Heligmosomoides polygyrus TaxID=6339 RepID=A0A183FBF0_HELPZ
LVFNSTSGHISESVSLLPYSALLLDKQRYSFNCQFYCSFPDGDLIELKTQRRALEGTFWKQKSMKWWLQSFLLGIRDIVVGYRDDDGIVNKAMFVICTPDNPPGRSTNEFSDYDLGRPIHKYLL